MSEPKHLKCFDVISTNVSSKFIHIDKGMCRYFVHLLHNANHSYPNGSKPTVYD